MLAFTSYVCIYTYVGEAFVKIYVITSCICTVYICIFLIYSDMASLMRTVDKPVDFLSPPERYIRNISDFKEIVESFTPQNANILYANPNLASNITNKSVEFPLDCAALSTDNFTFDAFHHIEPYFSTPYSAYCASRKLQEPWKSAKGKDFMLPKLTKYLPTNLTVLPLPSDPPTEPQLIVHDNSK